MDDPCFQAAGWPIGSGMVESGNKLVVEARGHPLGEGAGMHWAREQVNPMLALRTSIWSDRWQEQWPHIRTALRPIAGQRHRARLQHPRAATQQEQMAQVAAIMATIPPKTIPGTCRPAANHPWRRPFSPRALHRTRINSPNAKL
jgi:hypothetical protein